MTQRLLLLLMLASVLCHAVVVQGAWAATGVGEQALHALLHWQGSAHHHHKHHHAGDHGHFHQDESPSSLKHVNADGALYAAALLPAGLIELPSLPRASLQVAVAAEPPIPFLERFKRPPRFAA